MITCNDKKNLLSRVRGLRHTIAIFPNQARSIDAKNREYVSEMSYHALIELRENLGEIVDSIEEIVRCSKILEGTIQHLDQKLSPIIESRANEMQRLALARFDGDIGDVEEEFQQDRRTLEERFIQTKRKFKEK